MNSAAAAQPAPQKRLGRSIGAIVAGSLVAIALTIGTDVVLRTVFSVSDPMPDRLLALATIYRTVYGVAGAYVVARLAPYAPMRHALISGAIGFAVSVLGAVATWNSGLGPHWYPLALVVLAMPQAWAGGKLGALQQVRADR